MTLGIKLQELRTLSNLTLRQVEEATGVSNAYLSQLENDKIKKPSAHALYKLATIYGVGIDTLLIAAGIIQQVEALPYFPVQITKDEEQELIEYLKWLRFKNKKS